MSVKRTLNYFLIFTLLSCISVSRNPASEKEESLVHIKSNLEFLASDELQGRETTKQGSKIAGQFIASRLKSYGLKTFGDSTSYFQNFNLQNTVFLVNSSVDLFMPDSTQLILGEDFIPFQTGEPLIKNELIYLGYGISDSALNYDDYQNIDVTGKTVLCLYGIPKKKDDPDYFKEGNRWRSSSQKTATARKKGAAAIIIVQSEHWAKNWKRLGRNINGSISRIKEENGINAVWIDSITVKELFAFPNLKYSQIRDTLNNGYIKVGTRMHMQASFNLSKKVEIVKARNILGLLEGHGPPDGKLTLIGAHYDHLGIRGDNIYNGADDNASGTSALLESARYLSGLGMNRDPIIFCFWDAEEKGLLGSEYFACTFEKKDRIRSYINMDMIGREHPDSIFTFGAKFYSSELNDLVKKANQKHSYFNLDYSFDDVNHPQRPYQRSDHWNFAKIKIPFVAFADKHNAKKNNDYHKPTDTTKHISYIKVYKSSRLISDIALELANLNHELTVATTAGPGQNNI